jgi:hypothetical protein
MIEGEYVPLPFKPLKERIGWIINQEEDSV